MRLRFLLIPALLLTAAWTTACTSAPPRLEPALPVEVPETWAAPATAAAPVDTADPWWRTLGDERLDTLVEEALRENRDLAAAAARVEAAAAQARIAGADTRPQVGASLDASRRRQNFLGFPIPGGEERVLSTTNTSLQAGLNVSWEVDLWGRLSGGAEAALARAQASRADLAAARLSLTGQVAKAWFAVAEAQEQVVLARATVDNRALTERRIRRRYEGGLRPALELRLAIAERAGAEALLQARGRQLDAARRRLELLLGRYPDGELPDGPATLATTPPDPVPAGVPAGVLVRRPDLVAAERRLAAAGLEVEAARAALLPRITLTGSAGRSSQELIDLLDSDFSVWSLAAGLLQPIFQGGRLRAGVELADARQREVAAGYVTAALTAFSEVEGALAAERFLTGRVRALEESRRQSVAARDLAQERYAAGLQDYLTVLESQRRAFEAESQLLVARRERLDNRVDLHLALGGGFRAGADRAPGTAAHSAAAQGRGAHPTTAKTLEPDSHRRPEEVPAGITTKGTVLSTTGEPR